ncbi:gas vesicle synthesis protein GvpLGvpF [Streptomyces mobaraensis NBRC 13819 = DSM 40847]|uniref:Gas vesicle synthesis protein GvpLGvpF n=1 Tax=Streptomyces mobaraensis (strain ATCC 29032 / DSM 40847 / JCM 4168 / NBRC 13819 / NCIMB 11159 / IPCR 16-22) TaxID=1223523 RepID=M3BHF7_STRM1|nr:GvpL/GvpF family gas vesicle protein [Streptomyces mobaraensis]EME98994.1 gas vesicle synthesis protein GvpLGvpF [Streptomyces mobaraensis NBRC 13819 = DSM 40847]
MTTGEPVVGGESAAKADLLYAYAVARDTGTARNVPDTVTGVAGEPVREVCHEGFAALVGRVPAADFEEDALRERLEDLAWLERVARGHQRVVDAAVSLFPCALPLRLATVYHDEDGLRRMLTAGREAFGTALDRLEGRVEWGVTVYAAPAPAAPAPPPKPSGPPSGRDYLRRRGAERRAAETGARQEARRAEAVHETLAALAEAVRLYPPQNPPLAAHPGRNLLNAAYLVPRDRAEEFTRTVSALTDRAADGFRIRLTGPWAPYSFVTHDPCVPDAP